MDRSNRWINRCNECIIINIINYYSFIHTCTYNVIICTCILIKVAMNALHSDIYLTTSDVYIRICICIVVLK